MGYSKTTWVDEVTPTSAANLNKMEQGIFVASAPIVTVLPSAPVDEQRVLFLADAANGVLWHLVYRQAETGPYKWYFAGGGSVYRDGTPAADQTTTGTWIMQAGMPSWTAPLAGDYDVDHGHWHWHTASVGTVRQGVAVNGTTPAAGSLGEAMTQVSTGNADQYSVMGARRVTAAPLNATLDLRTWVNAATGKIRGCWMRITPVRVAAS